MHAYVELATLSCLWVLAFFPVGARGFIGKLLHSFLLPVECAEGPSQSVEKKEVCGRAWSVCAWASVGIE